MRKIILICLSFLFFSQAAMGACCLVPCAAFTAQQRTQYEIKLKTAYTRLSANLDVLKESYKQQREKLLAQNKELKSRLAVLKESAVQDSEIIFLLKQYNQLQSNENTQRSLK